jgi:UDP-2,3-diacylglucosamine pyrophosphatase LpxH
VNGILRIMGRQPISLSRKVKDGVKEAVKFINRFEETAAEIAINKGYEYVICGHIHKAEMRKVSTKNGQVMYLNSGDWVESLTSLEYDEGKWSLYRYNEDPEVKYINRKLLRRSEKKNKQLFQEMLAEFQMLNVS